MRKTAEINQPNSCFNKAEADEPIFVLLGRDPDAPATVLDWIHRAMLGNRQPMQKLAEAYGLAQQMITFREKRENLHARVATVGSVDTVTFKSEGNTVRDTAAKGAGSDKPDGVDFGAMPAATTMHNTTYRHTTDDSVSGMVRLVQQREERGRKATRKVAAIGTRMSSAEIRGKYGKPAGWLGETWVDIGYLPEGVGLAEFVNDLVLRDGTVLRVVDVLECRCQPGTPSTMRPRIQEYTVGVQSVPLVVNVVEYDADVEEEEDEDDDE